jgi:hypothetical protein
LGRMLKKNNWNIPELTLFCWLSMVNTLKSKAERGSGPPNFCTVYTRLHLRFIYLCMSYNVCLKLRFGSRAKMGQKCPGFWTQPNTKGLELKGFTKLAYLVDIFSHMNVLHLSLQGKAANEFICRIKLKQW